MTDKLARLTLRLYPLAFQRRYGEEMRALLEQSPPGVRGVLNLIRGALVAHLRPPQAAAAYVDPADRVRASAGGVLLCWVVFAAAGFGFYKTTEDAPFSAAGRAHPLALGGAHVAAQAIALIASAVVVLGALPLIWAAFQHARAEHRLRIVVRPILPLILFGCLTAILVAVAGSQPGLHRTGTTAGDVAFTIWGLSGLGCGLACTIGCRETLFATPTTPGRLLLALGSATLVSFAMVAIAAAVAAYAIALVADVPGLSASPNGPFALLSTGASLLVQVIAMVLAGALALTATRRGWRVAGEMTGLG
jgi:hypothetical protein